MKSYLVLLLAGSTLLFAGCEDPCKVGFKLKGDVTALDTTVSGTIVTPEAFDLTCQNFTNVDEAMLKKGADFATRAANDYLTWTEHLCQHSHYEQHCGIVTPGHGWYSDPWHSYPGPVVGPGYGCDRMFVCDDPVVIPHHKDGYEQAVQLSVNLSAAALDLKSACLEHSKGDTVQALVALAETKGQLHESLTNAETVLQRVGCYSRRGD